MKILFVNDASNFHRTLAKALKEMGHIAVVASGGSGMMHTERDINIRRSETKFGGIKYLYNILRVLPHLKGYDVVHITNPNVLQLRPWLNRLIFKYLKANNSKIYLSALATDYNYVKACVECEKFKYSDFRIGNAPSPYSLAFPETERKWLKPKMRRLTDYIIKNIDGAISCLYEYNITYSDLIPDKLMYGGIPIDMQEANYTPIDKEPEKVRFFIGIQSSRTILKGTDIMLTALKKITEKYPNKSEMCIVSDLPYSQYIEKMNGFHVLLDQLYSYTPATNALVAMAKGLVVFSGGEPEYYEFIGEMDNHPIINVSPCEPDDVEKKLEWIILNKHLIPKLSRDSHEFVAKHNDSRIVAQRHIDFWEK